MKSAILSCLFILPAAGVVLGDNQRGEAVNSPPAAAKTAAPPESLADLVDRLGIRLPEWAEELAAVLRGEGMDEGKGWWRPSSSLLGWAWLRDRFDSDRDGKIDPREVSLPRDRFDRLDRNEDGVLSRVDLEDPRPAAPPPLVQKIFGRLDSDGNDRVSWDELSWFFQQTDRRKRGFISPQDLSASLAALVSKAEGAPAAPRHGDWAGSEEERSRWRLLRRFLMGELGSFQEGPTLGAEAPDFSLPSLNGAKRISLAAARGKRPVVLIFGSLT